MAASVLILPVMSTERFDHCGGGLVHRAGVDLGRQRLLPSSDRRNVVVLERVRQERELEAMRRAWQREIGP